MEKEVFLDTETTGVNPFLHGVHQIAGEIWVDGSLKDTFDFRFRPLSGTVIDLESIAISGLTLEDLKARPMKGRDAQVSLNQLLCRYVNKYDKTDKFKFIGYNAGFDWNMMNQFWKKSGDDYFGSLFWFPPLDVCQEIFQFLGVSRRMRLPNFKLATLAKHFRINAEGYHDALVDIQVTRELYRLVMSCRNILLPEASPELDAAARAWADGAVGGPAPEVVMRARSLLLI